MLLLALPQVPFWAAGFGLTMARPIFNLDLIVAVLIGSWFRRTGMALLALFWVIDALRAVSLTYHFNSPLDLLRSAHFAPLLDLGHLISLPMVAGVCVLALVSVLIYRSLPVGRHSAGLLLLTGGLLCLIDIGNGSSQFVHMGREQLRIGVNVLGSPSANTIRTVASAIKNSGAPMRPLPRPVANEAIREWHAAHPRQSALLVIIESMGLPVSADLTDWLQGQLVTPAIAERWTVTRTVDDFAGSTTYGELRVLCGVYGHYSQIPASSGNSDCLPWVMRREGMQAEALHGFDLRMFDRDSWWPKVGLKPYAFGEFVSMSSGSRGHVCNEAFPGICDEVLLHEAVRLSAQPSSFVYALTLDTHLPLAPEGAPIDDVLRTLCERHSVPDGACLMVARLGAVLRSLRGELMASDATPLVVVVGDHSPPFVSASNRKAFMADRVPVWILKPR